MDLVFTLAGNGWLSVLQSTTFLKELQLSVYVSETKSLTMTSKPLINLENMNLALGYGEFEGIPRD